MRLYFSRAEQIVAALLLLAILVALGILVARQGRGMLTRREEPLLQTASGAPQPLSATPAAPGGPVVHVVGAVKSPGVYTLAPGARLNDALLAAGGARADGAPDALNLAEHAVDGQRIEVPTKTEYQQLRAGQPPAPLVITPAQPAPSAPRQSSPAETPAPSAQPYPKLVSTDAATSTANSAPASATPSHSAAHQPPALVHINTATAEQLDTLPGVGPATAQKILDYRKTNGPFKSVDELDNVKGIGPAKLAKMRPFVAL